MVISRLETRCRTGVAVAILDPSTGATNQMVMIVVLAALEPCGVPGRLDAAHQAGIHANRQHAVNGLLGYHIEFRTDTLVDLLRRGMRMLGQPLEHGVAWRSHPQAVSA